MVVIILTACGSGSDKSGSNDTSSSSNSSSSSNNEAQSADVAPTNTPLPTNTPVPDNLLFYDDFDDGIKSDWGMKGSGFASVNRKLVLQNGRVETNVVGDSSWENYKVTFVLDHQGHMSIHISLRVQNPINYMQLKCDRSSQWVKCLWFRVVDGEEQQIPGSKFTLHDGLLSIEMHGNIYLTIMNDEQVNRFVDDTFNNGGFAWYAEQDDYGNRKLSVDAIEVEALP